MKSLLIFLLTACFMVPTAVPAYAGQDEKTLYPFIPNRYARLPVESLMMYTCWPGL